MNDDRLSEEIQALRVDLRRHVRNGLLVFSGAVLLVCAVFGLERKEVVELAKVALVAGIFAGGLWLVGLTFQALFGTLHRRREERESLAILSGRSRVSRRR